MQRERFQLAEEVSDVAFGVVEAGFVFVANALGDGAERRVVPEFLQDKKAGVVDHETIARRWIEDEALVVEGQVRDFVHRCASRSKCSHSGILKCGDGAGGYHFLEEKARTI